MPNEQNINAIIIIMRLINMSMLQLEGSKGHSNPQYATLWHRWQAPVEEVFYDDFHAGRRRLAGGCFEIKNRCHMALLQGRQCRGKANQSTACTLGINRQQKHSPTSTMCIALASLPRMKSPRSETVVGPSVAGHCRNSLHRQRWLSSTAAGDLWAIRLTSAHTSLNNQHPQAVLRPDVSPYSVAQRTYVLGCRSQDYRSRKIELTTCLIGLFDINMPLTQGEGERPLFPCRRKSFNARPIRQSSHAWSDDEPEKGVLASSPRYFKNKYSNGL